MLPRINVPIREVQIWRRPIRLVPGKAFKHSGIFSGRCFDAIHSLKSTIADHKRWLGNSEKL